MTPADAEVLGIVQRIGPVVLSAAMTQTGTIGVALRRSVGMMIADPNMVNLPTFAYAFGVCTDLARYSGATLATMDVVRTAALAERPVSLAAVQTVLAIVRIALTMEARIIGDMTFASRDAIDAIWAAINDAFTQTEEVASDDLDSATYMALVNLHGTVITHLSDRARQLPRLINYSFQTVMTALRMAQRSYDDPTRYQELIAENDVVHPAFMPLAGKMLAV
jgi:prophage DNA circulation protein